MEEEFNLDFGIFNLYKLLSYKKNNKKIEEDSDILYKVTEEYLKQAGANKNFLNKPGVIERVSKIIFNNLLLSENTKISQKSVINNDIENGILQKLAVLDDKSIIFFNQDKESKKAFYISQLNDDVNCRFMEYYKDGGLKSEKRVVLDKFGFDKEVFEISEYNTDYYMNKKFREHFKPIIDHIDENKFHVYIDLGNPIITPDLDYKFLCKKTSTEISDSKKELIDDISFKDGEYIWYSYPKELKPLSEEYINKLKKNYTYLINAYSDSKQWFVDRFGKQFLQDYGIIDIDENIQENDIFEKILDANPEEVGLNYENLELSNLQCYEYIRRLYAEQELEKAGLIYRRLSEMEKYDLLKGKNNFDSGFKSVLVSNLANDELKCKLLDDPSLKFDVWGKVGIISSLQDELERVNHYNEIIDDVMERDTELAEKIEDMMSEQEDGEEINFIEDKYLSETILDTLESPEYKKLFLIEFNKFPILKYQHLKNFSKKDIDELLEEVGENFDLEEYVDLFKTKKVDDDFILSVLENNWEEGLNVSTGNEVEIDEDEMYTFKVFALKNVKDEEKRFDFIDENIDFFEQDEIAILLEDIEDVSLQVNLAKKYDLSPDYYYYMISKGTDEEKISFLSKEKNLDIDNCIIVANSFHNKKDVLNYFINTEKKMVILDRMKVINGLETEPENEEDVYEEKLKFLKQNSNNIKNAIKSKKDKEVFDIFVKDLKQKGLSFPVFSDDDGVSL